MLEEMLNKLLNASTGKEKEKAYRDLEKLGIDRAIARLLAAELKGKWQQKD